MKLPLAPGRAHAHRPRLDGEPCRNRAFLPVPWRDPRSRPTPPVPPSPASRATPWPPWLDPHRLLRRFRLSAAPTAPACRQPVRPPSAAPALAPAFCGPRSRLRRTETGRPQGRISPQPSRFCPSSVRPLSFNGPATVLPFAWQQSGRKCHRPS